MAADERRTLGNEHFHETAVQPEQLKRPSGGIRNAAEQEIRRRAGTVSIRFQHWIQAQNAFGRDGT
ncbi:MAG: hypothetical protein Q9P14_00270 [candidate division KSB1 bacterium]|nr:hypothetical protein [candidate division KSB1 bacterium]